MLIVVRKVNNDDDYYYDGMGATISPQKLHILWNDKNLLLSLALDVLAPLDSFALDSLADPQAIAI